MTRVDVFDSTSWSPFMNMTKELAAQGGTEMDGSIYLFGGSNDGGSSNEVFLIAIDAKNMTSLTAMPSVTITFLPRPSRKLMANV